MKQECSKRKVFRTSNSYNALPSHRTSLARAVSAALVVGAGFFFQSGAFAADSDQATNTNAGSTSNDTQQLDTVTVQAASVHVAGAQKETAPASVDTLNSEQLQQYAGLSSAGTGALAYVPGVFYSGGDSSGIQEGNFSVRGFTNSQIGVTRDGVPLNDPLYQTPHVDFMGDPENYDSIGVQYGSSTVDSPNLSASGGSVSIKTVAPTKDAEVLFKEGIGNYGLERKFLRANLGEHDGFSAWVSGSIAQSDLWTDSPGDDNAWRVEGNLQYKWGEGNQVNFIFSQFDMRTNSYLNPTLAQYESEPYAATYPNVASPTAEPNAVPQAGANLETASFKIQTYGLNGVFNLSDSAKLYVDPYFVHVADGIATFAAIPLPGALFSPSVNFGDTASTRTVALGVLPTQNRVGSTQRLDLALTDANTLELGLWYDYLHALNQQPAFLIGYDGAPTEINGGGKATGVDGNPLYFANQTDYSQVYKVWVKDDWHFASQWTFSPSLAYLTQNVEWDNQAGLLSGNAYSRSATYVRFLPSGQLTFDLDSQNQFYLNETTNIRTPEIGSVVGETDTLNQKPETTWNQELGWRYSTDALLVNTAFFFDKFKNLQASYQPIANGPTEYRNAGDVTIAGLDFSLHGNLPHDFHYFGSWTYTSAQLEDDYSIGGVSAPTKNKQLYNTPRTLASLSFGYDDRRVYANIVGHYHSGFYGDFANTERIGGKGVVDLNAGYRIQPANDWFGVKQATISLNVNNLFNAHYISGVSSGSVSANPSDNFYSAPTYWRAEPINFFANLALTF